MNPGTVPDCLQYMTLIEELLIARACPIMTIYRGQLGYSGHMSQNIQPKLPVNVSQLTITRQGAANTP